MVDLTDSYEERDGFSAPRVVCGVDGVPVGRSRFGRWVHLDDLPEKTDPEHEVQAVNASRYNAMQMSGTSLRLAAADMLRHHSTLHPDVGCEWAAALMNALRSQ